MKDQVTKRITQLLHIWYMLATLVGAFVELVLGVIPVLLVIGISKLGLLDTRGETLKTHIEWIFGRFIDTFKAFKNN